MKRRYLNAAERSENLIEMTVVAKRFGHDHVTRFRMKEAPRLGIRPVRQGRFWFVLQSDFDRALQTLKTTE